MFWHHEKGSESGYEDAIVVGKGVRVPWSGWRKFYVTGCIVLIIAACVTGFIAWRANVRAHKARVSSEGPVQTAMLQEAAQMEHQGRYGEESALLKKYLKGNPPRKYRYEPLMILGNLAYEKHDDAGAVKYYQEAVSADNGDMKAIDAEAIAEAAQAAGNKDMAIQYYKLAIQLTKVQPGVANNIDEFKQTIKYLGGTP